MRREAGSESYRVEYFWTSAPNMHWAKVASSTAHAPYMVIMCGSSQMGPWFATWNSHGAVGSPRSAGFSRANSHPAR